MEDTFGAGKIVDGIGHLTREMASGIGAMDGLYGLFYREAYTIQDHFKYRFKAT